MSDAVFKAEVQAVSDAVAEIWSIQVQHEKRLDTLEDAGRDERKAIGRLAHRVDKLSDRLNKNDYRLSGFNAELSERIAAIEACLDGIRADTASLGASHRAHPMFKLLTAILRHWPADRGSEAKTSVHLEGVPITAETFHKYSAKGPATRLDRKSDSEAKRTREYNRWRASRSTARSATEAGAVIPPFEKLDLFRAFQAIQAEINLAFSLLKTGVSVSIGDRQSNRRHEHLFEDYKEAIVWTIQTITEVYPDSEFVQRLKRGDFTREA